MGTLETNSVGTLVDGALEGSPEGPTVGTLGVGNADGDRVDRNNPFAQLR